MDIIIVGNGKVGFSLAEQLVKESHNVNVVDLRGDPLRRAGDLLDVMTIRGNGVKSDLGGASLVLRKFLVRSSDFSPSRL